MHVLFRVLNETGHSVARKHVLRLSPAMKRTFCRSCYSGLTPAPVVSQQGSSFFVENMQSKGKVSVFLGCLKCNTCGEVRRFGLDSNVVAEGGLTCSDKVTRLA